MLMMLTAALKPYIVLVFSSSHSLSFFLTTQPLSNTQCALLSFLYSSVNYTLF